MLRQLDSVQTAAIRQLPYRNPDECTHARARQACLDARNAGWNYLTAHRFMLHRWPAFIILASRGPDSLTSVLVDGWSDIVTCNKPAQHPIHERFDGFYAHEDFTILIAYAQKHCRSLFREKVADRSLFLGVGIAIGMCLAMYFGYAEIGNATPLYAFLAVLIGGWALSWPATALWWKYSARARMYGSARPLPLVSARGHSS